MIDTEPPRPSGYAAMLGARARFERFATCHARERFGDLFTPDEAVAIAHLALCRAAHAFRADNGASFDTYARSWVFGALARAAESELRQRRLLAAMRTHATVAERTHAPVGADRLEARRLLEALPSHQAEILVEHAVEDTTLASLARGRGRHASWASRQYHDALERTRRRLTRSRR